MRNSVLPVQKSESKITAFFIKILWKTEGHRCVAFYSTLLYILMALLLGRETDAGAISALLMLYGAAQCKDAFTDFIDRNNNGIDDRRER